MKKTKLVKSAAAIAMALVLLLQTVLPSNFTVFGLMQTFAVEATGPAVEITELNLISNGAVSSAWFQSAKLTRSAIDRSGKKISLSLSAAISNNYLENTVWDFMDNECCDMDLAQITQALETKYSESLPKISLTFSGDYFAFPAAVIGEENEAEMLNSDGDLVATRLVEKNGNDYTLTLSFNLERVANYEENIKGECSFEIFMLDDYAELQKVSLGYGESGNKVGLLLNPLNAADAKDPNEAHPVYTLEKNATNAVNGVADDFYIDYEITASVKSSTGSDGDLKLADYLDGMFIDEILPKTLVDEAETNLLNIDSVYIGGSPITATSSANGISRYQIPDNDVKTGEYKTVTLTLHTSVSNAVYKDYLKKCSIDVDVENAAKLYAKDGTTELANAANTVKLQKAFFAKSGTQSLTDSRIMNWTLTANASHSHATGIYLVDRVVKSSHEYERDSISVTVDNGADGIVTPDITSEFAAENTIDISDSDYCETLTDDQKAAVDTFLALGSGDVYAGIKGDLTHSGASGDCKDLYTALGLSNDKVVFFGYTYDEVDYECFILPMDDFFANTDDTINGLKAYKCELKINYDTKIAAESDGAYIDAVKNGFSAKLKNDAKIVCDHICGGVGPGKDVFAFDFGLSKDYTVQINSFVKKSVSYTPKTQEVLWNFQVNRYGTAMDDFYLVDVVPASEMKFVGTDPISAKVVSNESNIQLVENGTLTIPYFEAGSLAVAEETINAENGEKGWDVTNFGGLSGSTYGYTYAKIGENYVFVIKLGGISEDNHLEFDLKTKVIDEAFLANTDSKVFENAASGWTKTDENGDYSCYNKTASISARNALIEKSVVTKKQRRKRLYL